MTTPQQAAYSAVDAYAAAQYAQGKSDQLGADQPKLDAFASQVADLQAQIAELQGELHPVQINECVDFADDDSSGFWFASDSVVGSGADPSKTIYRVKEHTSTKADEVAKIAKGGSVPYRIIRTDGMSNARRTKNLEYANFTVEGTDQGHIYGGLNVQYGSGAHIHDLVITGIPGSSNSPPGETFSLALWHQDGALIEDVVLDGVRQSDGEMVAATLFGLNTVNGCIARRVVARHARYGMSIAIWDSSGELTFDDCDFSQSRRPINVEQIHDGAVVTFNRPDLSKMLDPTQAHISFNSTLGKAKLYVVDPVADKWPIKISVPVMGSTNSNGRGTNTIDRADIHLIINGQDVSKDKTKMSF